MNHTGRVLGVFAGGLLLSMLAGCAAMDRDMAEPAVAGATTTTAASDERCAMHDQLGMPVPSSNPLVWRQSEQCPSPTDTQSLAVASREPRGRRVALTSR